MVTAPDSPGINQLARGQAGVVSRRQVLAAGLTLAQLTAALEAGRWQRLLPGVYLTHGGQVEHRTRVWAVVLAAGEGAVCGPVSTLWLQGLGHEIPAVIDVWVPHERRVRPAPGMRVRSRRRVDSDTHPSASPPQLRLERAVIEVARQAPRAEAAVDVLISAVQQRRTTATRLLAELAADHAHPRRTLITDVLADVEAGVRSQLERRWVQRVERPHGLPRGVLNAAESEGCTRRYRDVRYDPWGVICELDGREAHPDDERFRDRARDNRVIASGRAPLRYGWREVAGDPCRVAAELAAVLRSRGWTGEPAPCSPACPIAARGNFDGP